MDEEGEDFRTLGVKTAKGSTIYLTGQAVNALISLLIVIYLARTLKPEFYGIYTIVMAYSLVIGMGGNFGIGTAFRKMIPETAREKERIRSIISNGAVVSLGVAAIIALAGVIASPYIASFVYHNASITLPLRIAALATLLAVLLNAGQAALVGMHRTREATTANISYNSIQLVLVVLLITAGYGVLGAMAAYAASLAIGSLVAFGYIAREIGPKIAGIERKVMRELTNFSIPIVVSNVATTGLLNFAPMLLGVFAGAAIVGNYGVALKGSRFVDMMIQSSTFVLLASFSALLSKEAIKNKIGSAFNSSVYYASLIFLPLIAYMIGSAYPLVYLLFSHAYTLAPVYVSIALAGLSAEIVWSIGSALVLGHGNSRRFMQYQLTIVAIELAALLILTPLYKAYGAIFAVFIIAPIAASSLYARLLGKEFGVKLSLSGPAKIGAASIVLALLLLGVTFAMHDSKYAIAVNALLLLAIYPALLSAFRAISAKQLEFIRDAAASMRGAGRLVSPYLSYMEFLNKGIKK